MKAKARICRPVLACRGLGIAVALCLIATPLQARGANQGSNAQSFLITACTLRNHQADNRYWAYCIGETWGAAFAFPAGIDLGYAGGVGHVLTNSSKAELNARLPYCIPDDASRQQVALVVTDYLVAHPEKWGSSDLQLIVDALSHAWPCKATQSNGR